MKLNVHIERLILENGSMDLHEQIKLRVALEAALGRLIADNGFSLWPDLNNAATPAAAAGATTAHKDGAPSVGEKIARAVYPYL